MITLAATMVGAPRANEWKTLSKTWRLKGIVLYYTLRKQKRATRWIWFALQECFFDRDILTYSYNTLGGEFLDSNLKIPSEKTNMLYLRQPFVIIYDTTPIKRSLGSKFSLMNTKIFRHLSVGSAMTCASALRLWLLWYLRARIPARNEKGSDITGSYKK